MEDSELRDPEVWARYTKTREEARQAYDDLDVRREKMHVLEDQYVDAERKLIKMLNMIDCIA